MGGGPETVFGVRLHLRYSNRADHEALTPTPCLVITLSPLGSGTRRRLKRDSGRLWLDHCPPLSTLGKNDGHAACTFVSGSMELPLVKSSSISVKLFRRIIGLCRKHAAAPPTRAEMISHLSSQGSVQSSGTVALDPFGPSIALTHLSIFPRIPRIPPWVSEKRPRRSCTYDTLGS
jgi:hypothetical protein